MSTLTLTRNTAQPDEFYAKLLAAHDGLDKVESDALNARLILVLANQIGDQDVLEEALKAATLSAKQE